MEVQSHSGQGPLKPLLFNRPFILLIDDDENQLAIFKTLLEQANYNVIDVCSAEKGLQVLNEVHVELVICDVNMPGMDGKEFIEAVRRREGLTNLPVITFSAAQRYAEEDLLHSGANKFCSKSNTRKLLKQANYLLASQTQDQNLLGQIRNRFN